MCALRTANHRYAASLTGIRNREGSEEEQLHLSTQLSLTPSSSPCEKLVGISPSPSSMSSSTIQPDYSSSKPCLPPLCLQLPLELAHPALRSIAESPASSTSQLDLPGTNVEEPCTPIRKNISNGHFHHTRNHTVGTSSSLFSRTFSKSTYSGYPSTMSSMSSSVYRSPSDSSPSIRKSILKMPAIPDRYRVSGLTYYHAGRPKRPDSKSDMPSAPFWMYTRTKQQECNATPEGADPNVWPGPATQTRVRARSNSSNSRQPSMCRYPVLQVSPDKRALRANHNKNNTMKATRSTSYESLRKGDIEIGLVAGLQGDANLDLRTKENRTQRMENGKPRTRPRSRTLVKQRQPWDSPPKKRLTGEYGDIAAVR